MLRFYSGVCRLINNLMLVFAGALEGRAYIGDRTIGCFGDILFVKQMGRPKAGEAYDLRL